MKVNSIYVGPLKIDKNEFFDWANPRLEKLGMFIERNTEKKEWRILSLETNVKFMKEGDERITKLNRPYLFTHALTLKQRDELNLFLKRNNIAFDCSPPICDWTIADKTEKELGA